MPLSSCQRHRVEAPYCEQQNMGAAHGHKNGRRGRAWPPRQDMKTALRHIGLREYASANVAHVWTLCETAEKLLPAFRGGLWNNKFK